MKKYVLVVDDDQDFANAIAQVVKSTGNEVAVRHDTNAAAECIKQRRPDLIVLDVMFPENDSAGFEFARYLNQVYGQASPKTAKLPVLMLTAINSKFPLGFNKKDIHDEWLPVEAFLEKPIDLDVLKQKVQSMLA